MRKGRVTVRTMPDLTALAQGQVAVSDLRELDIEDLLGRGSIAPDRALIDKNIRGKVVMVTGAGGSIGGSELCRQILKNAPSFARCWCGSDRGIQWLHAIHGEAADVGGNGLEMLISASFHSPRPSVMDSGSGRSWRHSNT